MNWEQLPSEEIIEKTAENMRARNFNVRIVNTKEDALKELNLTIPEGSSIMNGSSTTLEEIGMIEKLQNENIWNNLHEPIFKEEDASARNKLYRESLLADYYMASPNAITEDGIIVAVDRTGSRTGAFPFAAKHLVLVSGTNKITKDLNSAMQRIREYVLPLEDKRAQKAYGTGSEIGKWVIMEKEVNPDRVIVILVKDKLGF